MGEEHLFEKSLYAVVAFYLIGFTFVKSNTVTPYMKQLIKMIRSLNVSSKIEKISLIHTGIDFIALVYVIWNAQYLIAFLILCLISVNLWQYYAPYLRYNFRILEDFSVSLFHATFQLLPFVLSLTYYDTEDTFVNILFLFTLVSFVAIIFAESNRINSDYDNNTRITQIFALCIILDYIHILLLLQCKLYTTNNYYFYKFLFQSLPFCLGVQIAIVYHEWNSWIRILKRWHDLPYISIYIWNGFWFVMFLYFAIPIGAECINASWIILLYKELFSKLRQSKRFDENLKDSLVDWLNTDKDELLLKICCINHVKLINAKRQSALLTYLEKNHRKNNGFYVNVRWNGIRNNSPKLKNMNLIKTIRDQIVAFYRMDRIKNNVLHGWNGFLSDRSLRTFMRFIEESYEVGAVALMIVYGIICAFNIVTSPVIVLYVMYDRLNMHQTCFVSLYFLIFSIAMYKLYAMMNYERMMWYIIPDLSQYGCTQEEIDKFEKHYRYIKYEFIQIKQVLGEVFGDDVANIICLYVPDFIDEYKIDHRNETLS